MLENQNRMQRAVGSGVGLGISRGIEERAYGYPRGQLKKKWNFQRYSQESHVEFPLWVFWFLILDFLRESPNFEEFTGVKACFLDNF